MTHEYWKNIEAARERLTYVIYDGADDAYDVAAEEMWRALTVGHREVLQQLLYQGPVRDGNIISKSYRDDLIEIGLAVRCCFLGEDGYTAASYLAYDVFRMGGGTPIAKKMGSPA